MITIENIGNRIYKFGRKNMTPYIESDETFRPYFYVEDETGNFISVEGKKLNKIQLQYPSHVKMERQRYRNTYESDIRYTGRYIIDNFDKIEKENYRICHFDIEVEKTKNGYEGPEKAVNPISTIVCYDNFTQQYEFFYGEERQLLESFINYIRSYDPDILVAWNGDNFDFPFIINRLKKLKMNPNRLSRLNGNAFSADFGTKIFGRVLFDLMMAYKRRVATSQKESYSLDYISKHELGDKGGKVEYEGNLDDLRKTDFKKFIEYNKKDVELMVLLDEQLHIIEFFDELRRFSYSTFEDIFMTSKMADHLCLKYAKNHGFVLPSVKDNPKPDYEGGFVRESHPKLYNNVSVMDFKSLYPSLMITFNVSYETYNENGKINIDNMYRFRNDTKGMIPDILKPLLDRRDEIKKEMKNTKNEDEKHSLDLMQQAIKVVANSFYGVLGFTKFRLFKKEVAESITYIARRLIKRIAEWYEENNFEVVYGDTDSVFVKTYDLDIDSIQKWVQKSNDFLDNFAREYIGYDNENLIKLELEKLYKTIFFKRKADGTGAKKKYAGRLIWKDEKEMDIEHVMGFESRRSDSPQVGRDFLKEVLKKIVYEHDKEEIDNYVEEIKKKIRNDFSAEEIALPKGISKHLNEYENNMHVRAARNANERHNAKITKGDKVKFVFVKGDTVDVVAFKTEGKMWEGYIIDYDKMIRRIVDMKVGPIYRSLGWNYTYTIIESNKKKKKQKEINDILKQAELW